MVAAVDVFSDADALAYRRSHGVPMSSADLDRPLRQKGWLAREALSLRRAEGFGGGVLRPLQGPISRLQRREAPERNPSAHKDLPIELACGHDVRLEAPDATGVQDEAGLDHLEDRQASASVLSLG